MKFQPKWRRLLLALVFIAFITVVGFALTRLQTPPTQEPVAFFKTPYTIPTPRVGLLDRVMPLGPAWGWLWKLRYAILGKTRVLDINTTVVDLTGLDVSALTPAAKPDLASQDGFQVWRTRESDQYRVRQLLKDTPERLLFAPRVTTGDRVQASIYTGSPAITNGTQQLSADFLPIIRNNTLDLTATLQCSETVTNPDGIVITRTNVDLAGRFLLSQDTPGVLILATAPRSNQENRIAIILNSKVQQTKK